MYEPTYLPKMTEKTLPSVRFWLVYKNEFVDPDRSEIEPAHIHEYTEFVVDVSGNISFLVGNQVYPVGRGEVVLSKANEVHMCIYNEARRHEYFCLWVDERTASAFPFFEARESPIFTLHEEEQRTLQALLFALKNECEQGDNELKKTAYLFQILSLLSDADVKENRREKRPEALEIILDDICRNFAEIGRIGELCARHFVSSATLNRWFQKYVRLTPHEFLESQKLAFAAKLLMKGFSVTEACMQSGFSDCSHFITVFKKKFGKTPKRYGEKFEQL